MKIMRWVGAGMLLMSLVSLTQISFIAQAALPSPAAQNQEKPRPPLPNFVELSSGIATGGQPTGDGLKQLSQKGYKAVINIRALDEEYDQVAEEKLARQLGLRYYMVPFVSKEASEEQALAFNTLMSALKDTRVFIHCGSGNRVGSLMMIYFALEQGMPLDKAEEEARKAGLRSPDLLEFAKQVIGRHKK